MARDREIIRPQGLSLLEHLNRGTPICNECGAIMDRQPDPLGGCDVFVCPDCGDEVDEMDYKYIDADSDEDSDYDD